MTENLAGRGEGLAGLALKKLALQMGASLNVIIERSNQQKGKARNRTRRYAAMVEGWLRVARTALEAAAPPSTPLPPDWPECKEFYDLMQFYRHTPIVKQALVVENYEEVKHWLRKAVAALATPSPQAPQCCCNVSWLDLDQRDCPIHGPAATQEQPAGSGASEACITGAKDEQAAKVKCDTLNRLCGALAMETGGRK